ncbi:MAG: membrane protein insertase YidC [Bdellovibrionales bacterium]
MNNNVFLAVILSFGILFGFQYLYVKPHQEALHSQRVTQQVTPKTGTPAPAVVPTTRTLRDRNLVLKDSPRLAIDTPELSGSINLKGARFDDLLLKSYKESADKTSPSITLLAPSGSTPPHAAYYAEFSWLADSTATEVPSAETEWKADSKKLTPDHPINLTWSNGKNLIFNRTISVDAEAMFTITDRVINKGSEPVALYPFGIVARQGFSQIESSAVVHEGGLGVFKNTLEEYKYSKLMDEKKITQDGRGGWLGITDKYWLVAMIPPQDETLVGEFIYNRAGAATKEMGFFQADFRGSPVTVPVGGSAEHVSRLFAGAKKVGLLDRYADQYNLPHFDKAIDFGWFYFLTRPFLYLLTALDHAVGSMGLAILLFTILLKLVTLPLSQKSYHSMSRMKAIQPEMKRIQERFPEDKVRQSQEMMELYKREKVNPMSGCMPTLIQIPIFFALYKVLYVNIEMRQAPFYGWIQDMSAADPTSVLTLFGLIPITLPYALQIGVWPILMGLSMFLQQRLSPQPPDKTQARMFMFMPIIFTYMLVHMPAGLVIYWTWSNLLGILQQWYIMRGDLRRKGAAGA